MSFAPAIRRAKPRERNRGSLCIKKNSRPVVFVSHLVVQVPNLGDPQNWPQVINVPMPAEGMLHMMCNSGPNTSRTKRTTDVHVKSLPHAQDAESAYRDFSLTRGPTNECVRPRLASDVRQACYLRQHIARLTSWRMAGALTPLIARPFQR